MDSHVRETLSIQLIARINNLNIEISLSTCKDCEEKEKELKLLNELYASLRKVSNYYKPKK